MAKRKEVHQFYDTGGSGIMPTSVGRAAKWWVPFQYTSIQRVLMATRLAAGPATMKELEAVTGGYQSVIWHIVQNWVGQRFAEWTMHYPGGAHRGMRERIVTLTETGRRDLWRFGWVTRRLRFSENDDPPLLPDMPEDALEAVRLYARKELLRPAALAVMDELLMWGGKQNVREMAGHTGNLAATRAYMDIFRKAGFVTDIGPRETKYRQITYPRWVLNTYGLEVVDRHIDALRRMSGASGYVPTRECELYYPCQDSSPCASEICSFHPAPCADCPYWWLSER